MQLLLIEKVKPLSPSLRHSTYSIRYQSRSHSLPKFSNPTTLHLMASTTSSFATSSINIAQDSNQQLIAMDVSVEAPLKLNATNSLSWKL